MGVRLLLRPAQPVSDRLLLLLLLPTSIVWLRPPSTRELRWGAGGEYVGNAVGTMQGSKGLSAVRRALLLSHERRGRV